MLEMKYFVLKPKGTSVHAEASREAMFTYAEVLRHYKEDIELARELETWASREGRDHRHAVV
jgi:hypothetical protein